MSYKDPFETFVRNQVAKVKRKLMIAHMDLDVHKYIKRAALSALYAAITFAFIAFMMMHRFRSEALTNNILITILIFLGAYGLTFLFMIKIVDTYIAKRKKEIDQEVLFAGRYLLIKMHAGVPFFNSLIGASKAFGIAGKYFKEIIDEVNTGTPIEDVLEKAAELSPSTRFSIILREMNNALRLGVDISQTLELILDDIAYEQLEEIKRFSKKINAMSMFYMMVAVVIPSLGISIFIIITAFVGLTISLTHLIILVFLLVFVQFMFLALFRTIKPTVHL